MTNIEKLKIPDGWTIKRVEWIGDQAYLATPSPGRYVVTIDFASRGLRSGMVLHGRLLGDDLVKKTTRKKYAGRGWAQMLVDDAISHLREVLS